MRAFGRYQLIEPLASGGMAEVWRARATGPAGVEKEVALKLLRGEHAADSAFARMLVEEARLSTRLSHANIVQVFELVEEGGRHAIAMELVRGHDLGRVLDRARQAGLRLGLPRALQACVEVARALDYAHRLVDGGRPLGVVHRDVSPANVLVSHEGEVKLADFGIARATSQAGLTDPGVVKGKLAYMAPEQARGEPLDARADVFALGVLCWELCAGRRLFARDSDAATLGALLGPAPVSPPSAWNEAVPPALDAAVLAALDRDPAARTPSAGQLGEALSSVLLGLVRTPGDVDLRAFMRQLWPDGDRAPSQPAGQTAVRPAAPPAPRPSTGAVDASQEAAETRTLVRPGKPARRGRLVAGLAAASILLGLGAAAWRGRAAAPPRAQPAAALIRAPDLDAEAASRGEGRVMVAVHPWAALSVDGQPVGETPQDLRLPAGRHLLRAVHPALGGAELELDLEPGARLSWHPTLSR